MGNLARSREFCDLLLDIELKLISLGWIEVHRLKDKREVRVLETRLIEWAIACCKKSLPAEVVEQLAASRQPQHQWWTLRQMLPEAALITLNEKLDIFLAAQGREV